VDDKIVETIDFLNKTPTIKDPADKLKSNLMSILRPEKIPTVREENGKRITVMKPANPKAVKAIAAILDLWLAVPLKCEKSRAEIIPTIKESR